jgi:hypothetical protein
MTLRELEQIVPPPVVPLHPPTAEHWQALEAAVGPLPSDYVELATKYGSGSFGAEEGPGTFFDLAYFLSPGHPKQRRGDIGALPRMVDETDSLRELRQRFPDQVPTPVWPDPGGLLYAGGTTTRHAIYWKTKGKPDTWTCAVSDHYGDDWFEWNGDLSSLYLAIATANVPTWIVEGPTRFPLVFRDLATLSAMKLL